MTSIHRAALAAVLVLTAPLLTACEKKPAAIAEATCRTPEVQKEIIRLADRLEKLSVDVGDLQTNFEGAGEFLAQPGLSDADKKEGERQQADLGKKIDANAAETQATQAKLDKLKALKAC
jgi:hypothetical protein